MSVSSKNYLSALVFAVAHALCCITCRVLNTSDTFALTLLTVAMVVVLCYNRKVKWLFMLASTIICIVFAYIVGNAIPKVLDNYLGNTVWTYSISTFLTTLLLGCSFELLAGKLFKPELRKRWIVHINDRIVPVNTEHISYFISSDKYNYLVVTDGTKYIIDSTMDAIVKELDPSKFFRINRGAILSLGCINAVIKETGRYLVDTNPKTETPLVISRSRVEEFMKWLA